MFRNAMLLGVCAVIMVVAGNADAALVGHWSLDGVTGGAIVDSVTPSDAYTCAGPLTRVPGQFNEAIAAGGASYGYLESKNFDDMTTNGFTVMGWVNMDAIPTTNTVLIRQANDLGDNSAAGFFYGLGSGGVIKLHFGTSSGWQNPQSAAAVTSTNTWYHIATSWDPSATSQELTYYVNGVSIGGADTSGAFAQGASRFCLFAEAYASNGQFYSHFTGTADDLAIYTGVLTVDQIQNAMNNGVVPVPEPASIALLGMALLGLLCYAWKKRK